ncbi:MAG TPA: glycosyl hydrolase family 28-related protein [Paraburkholderia sp.]
MKKLLAAVLFSPLMALAQTYPSPTFSSLTLQNPLTVANGGTGSSSSTGSGALVLSSGPSIANLTITGSLTATGLVSTSALAAQAANTVLANVTGSAASPTAFAMPNCNSSSSALNFTGGTGWTCGTVASAGANSNITSLSGLTTAIPTNAGGLGANNGSASGVPVFSSGAATVTATTGTGSPVLANSPAITGTPTLPTAAVGTNTTQAATTAFVAKRVCADIMDYGGDNTGVSNNDTAYTNAIAAAPNTSTAICVYFPPGFYAFGSQDTYTYAASYVSVSIQGAGAGVTTLSWPANGGLKFVLKDGTDSIHLNGFSMVGGTVGTGTAITLNTAATALASAALSTIENIDIRGANGYFGTQYFNHGIDINSVSNVNINNVNAVGPGTPAGVGLNLNGTSSVLGIVYNISNSTFDQWNDGINYGPYIQGVQVTNSNFTNNNAGIFVPASESGINQLSVSNSQFNNVQYNILANSALPDVIITGNLFLVDNSSSGVNLQASSYFNITGNAFQPNSGSPSNVFGVVVNGWAVGAGIITGNMFYNLTTGIALQSTSKNVNVQSNVYNSCSANTSNSGTGNVIGGGSP